MRRPLTAVGLVVSLVGVAVASVPSLAASLPTARSLVVLVGVVATAYGLRELLSSRSDPDGPTVPPRVEGREVGSVPGRAFDRSLVAGDAFVRERLREVAVDVLADTPEQRREVETALDDGDWTDDRHAAAFFSVDAAPPSDGFDAADPRRQARHVVHELGRRVGRDWTAVARGPAEDRAVATTLDDSGEGDRDESWYVPRLGERIHRTTGKWAGLAGVALVAGGAGATVARPSLLLAGGLATALAGGVAVHRAGAAPSPSLAVSRTVAVEDPAPGDDVEVTTTVRNDGDDRLHDVRIVDGVPPATPVTDGAARTRCALAPGESVRLTYEVRVERGTHEFRPIHAVVADRIGDRETVLRAGERERAFECRQPATAADPGARRQASSLVGRLPSDAPGKGIEFHSLREYRRGDPLASVDWNRLARTGELATRRFDEHRRASVVVLVDARPVAYAAPDDDGRTAVDRSVEAADAVVGGLLDDGHAVGLAALSPADDACWIPPRSGSDHRVALRRSLATSPAMASTPAEGTFYPSVAKARVQERLSGSTQVVFCTPLVDDYAVELARSFEARGHCTTVVSPDPTGEATTGERLAAVERASRASDLRSVGVPVYDWAGDQSLALALARGAGGRR